MPQDSTAIRQPGSLALLRVVLGALLLLQAPALFAATPFVRSFEALARAGATDTRALTQDDRGFIWLAAESGLIRFDGQRAQHFAANARNCRVLSVSAHGAGVIAHDDCGHLFSVDPAGAVLTLLPGGVRTAASSGQRVFAVVGAALVELRAGELRPLGLTAAPEAFGFPRLLVADGALVLSSSASSWLLPIADDDLPVVPIPLLATDGSAIGDVVAAAGGRHRPLALLTRFPARLYSAGHTAAGGLAGPPRLELLHEERNRGIGLAWREERLWASLDIKLRGFDANRSLVEYAQDRELPSGGPLLVDRERSLWIGSISRVLQLPEPDALRLDRADGLVSAHGQAVLAEPWRGIDAVLALTWQGAHRLLHGRVLDHQPMQIYGTACTGNAHSWYAGRNHWHLDRADGQLQTGRASGDESQLTDCVQLHERDLAVSEMGLLERRGSSVAPRLVRAALEPGGAPGMDALAVAGDALWLARRDRICQWPLGDLARDGRCVRCTGARSISGLLAIDGYLLAAAPPLGIVRVANDSCVALTLDEDMLGAIPNGLALARSGGFWAFSNQAVLRLQQGSDDRLVVLETIGQAQGLTQMAAISVAETDQALWVANIEGYTRIGRASRDDLSELPLRLAPLRGMADGMPLRPGQELSAGTRMVELEFAALSFKAPHQLRYRHRIGNADGYGAWSVPSHHARLALSELQPGSYRIDVAAQRDPSSPWSSPELVEFSVRSAWQHTLWGRASIGLSILVVLGGMARMRYQKQRSLKQQRLQIAADLHDELGSELASVRVLTSLLKRPEIAAEERAALLGELEDSSTAASTNLRQLVTHMKHGTDLGQLLRQLNRLAARLCGTSLRSQFSLDEAGSATLLPETVFRQLWLLGSEVLNNVARHARANRVDLRATLHQGRLTLDFVDDGVGFDPADTTATGNGLQHLRQRAGILRARLLIDSLPRRGTTIRIELSL